MKNVYQDFTVFEKLSKMSHLNLGAKNQITNLKEKKNCEKKQK